MSGNGIKKLRVLRFILPSKMSFARASKSANRHVTLLVYYVTVATHLRHSVLITSQVYLDIPKQQAINLPNLIIFRNLKENPS